MEKRVIKIMICFRNTCLLSVSLLPAFQEVCSLAYFVLSVNFKYLFTSSFIEHLLSAGHPAKFWGIMVNRQGFQMCGENTLNHNYL